MLKQNFRALLRFEVLYKIFAFVSLYPFILFLLDYAIDEADINYLTNVNLLEFLRKPLSIAIIILITVMIVIYSLFELVVLTICYDLSHNGEKTDSITLFFTGLKQLWKFLRPESIFLFLLVLAASAFFNLPFASSLVSMTDLSDYMSIFWGSNHGFYIAAAVIEAVILFLISFLLFSIHYLIIENKKFGDALRASRNLVKGETIRNALRFAVWFFMLFVILAAIYGLLILAAAVTIKSIWPEDSQIAAFLSSARIINQVMSIFIYVIFTPLAFLMVSSIFYSQKEHRNEHQVSVIHPRTNKKINKFLAILLVSFLGTSIFLNFNVINMSLQNNVLRNIEIIRTPAITAHRGSALEAPENTLSAVEIAASELADYAEIDVRSTKDGVVVLLHDENLQRTTGVDRKIWDVTYEETQSYDVGSWHSDQYIEERIPTLDEIIKFANGKIMLNIEIKSSDHSPKLVESVVKIIEDNQFEGQCVISTFDYSELYRIKTLNPGIKTGIIITVAYAKYSHLSNVDFYSMNARFLTRDKIERLHFLGYQVYAWNVTNPSTVKRLMNMGVDNIITNDTLMAKEIVYKDSANLFVLKIAEYVFGDTELTQDNITNIFLPYW